MTERSIPLGLGILLIVSFAVAMPRPAAAGGLPAISRLGDTVTLGEAYGGPLVFGADRPEAGAEAFRFGPKVRGATVPGSGRSAIVGRTAVTVTFRRNLRPGRDNDNLWAELNGSAFSLLEFEAVRSRHCDDAVYWNAGDTIFGRQFGITCKRSIRLRTANPVQWASIRKGTVRWTFEIDQLGEPVVGRVKVRRDSRVSFTSKAHDEVRLKQVPERVSVGVGETVRIPFTVVNQGGRASTGVTAHIGTVEVVQILGQGPGTPEDDEGEGVTPLKPVSVRLPRLPVGADRESSFAVRGERPGSHPVWIDISGTASGDFVKVMVDVTAVSAQ